MHRIFALYLCLVLFSVVTAFSAVTAAAQDAGTDGKAGSTQTMSEDGQRGAKELSGMSIVGNDEAPKSLYIVPWKSSELGVEASLNTVLNEGDVPVDRDVFKLQLEFYRISRQK